MNHPPSGKYRIMSRELGCYASVRHGENVLRGAPEDPDQYDQTWIMTVDHEEGDDHEYCSFTLTMASQGDRSLTVNSVSDNQPVYSIGSGRSWFLREIDNCVVSIFLGDAGGYNWYIGNENDPIVIRQADANPQGWEFVLVVD